jgi:hypothetical protein
MKYFIPLLLGLLFFTGCKKEDPDKAIIGESLWPCYQATEFTCSGAQADVHFSGKLNGNEFCLNEGEKEYERYNVIGSNIVTGGGGTQKVGAFVLGLHRIPRLYSQPYVYLWYYAGGSFSLREVVDSAFQVGKLHWIKDLESSFTERGFKLEINFICPDGDAFNGSPSMGFDTYGPQKNAYIRCTRLEKTETTEGTLYKVTLQMGCDLYNGNQVLWRTLTDGEYTQEFLIKK